MSQLINLINAILFSKQISDLSILQDKQIEFTSPNFHVGASVIITMNYLHFQRKSQCYKSTETETQKYIFN